MTAEEFYKSRFRIIPKNENSFSQDELFEFAEAYAKYENEELLKYRRSASDTIDEQKQVTGIVEYENETLQKENEELKALLRDAIHNPEKAHRGDWKMRLEQALKD